MLPAWNGDWCAWVTAASAMLTPGYIFLSSWFWETGNSFGLGFLPLKKIHLHKMEPLINVILSLEYFSFCPIAAHEILFSSVDIFKNYICFLSSNWNGLLSRFPLWHKLIHCLSIQLHSSSQDSERKKADYWPKYYMNVSASAFDRILTPLWNFISFAACQALRASGQGGLQWSSILWT